MLGLSPEAVAVLLIGAGLLLSGGIWIFLRVQLLSVREDRPAPRTADTIALPDESSQAVLLIAPGGHVIYANDRFREWLHLPEGALPNLEHAASRSQPAEAFIERCGSPGQSRLTVQGRLVEAQSVRIPYLGGTAMVVSLSRPDLTGLSDRTIEDHSALRVLSELSTAMTSNLDVTDTVASILESIGQVVPADIAEITIWNRSENRLVPYRLAGLPGTDRRLETPVERYPVDFGPSGRLLRERTPLRVNRNGSGPPDQPEIDKPFPFQSYLGVPLIIGDESIGTLELAALTDRAFTDQDLETLRLLSNQASVALHHALTREDESRRVAELSGLANLAQVAGTLRESGELFTQLLDSILPLVDVEVLGFLIFDENTHRLQAALPFAGIPDDFARLYAASIEPGSEAERIFLARKPVISLAPADDPELQALDLAHLAQAAGLRNTVLSPLTVGGRSLGYLQAANKAEGTAYGEEELRILSIVSGQSAAIIDNARLLEDSRRRTRQAEALRRIAALASSAATLDEILRFSLTEIARLLGADNAVIFLLNQEQYELSLHPGSVFGKQPAELKGLLDLKTEDPLFTRTATASQRAKIFRRNSPELETDPVYKNAVERLDAESAISVPLIIRDRSVGEILFGSSTEDFFRSAEIEIAASAAGQIAGAIERAIAKDQTDETLRRRVDELTSLTRISRELSSSDDLEHLLIRIHAEALATTGADCGTVFLLDPDREEPRIDFLAGEGEVAAYTLSESELSVLASGASHLVDRFDGEGAPPHPVVRSALVLPIDFQASRIGLMNLHAETPNRFDAAAIEIAQSLAIQAGIALGNSRRLQAEIAERRRIETVLQETRPRLVTVEPGGHDGEPLPGAAVPARSAISQPVPLDGDLQTDSLQDLKQRTSRVQAILEIIHSVNQKPDRERVFEQIGTDLVARLGFEYGFVAVPSDQGAVLVSTAGEIPDQVNPEVLLGQRNPLRQTLRSGEMLLVADLNAKGGEVWRGTPLLDQLHAEAFICIPVSDPADESPAAAFLAVSTEPQPAFKQNDAEIFALLGRQVAAALRSLDLRERTEERLREVDLLLNFSRQLGSLEAGEVIRALANNARQVVKGAQAVLIGLWDERRAAIIPEVVSGYRNDDAMRAIHFEPGGTLPGKVFEDGRIRRIGEVNIAEEYNLPYDQLIRYQEATQGRVPIASLAAPIPSSSATLGVLILDNFSEPDAFTEEDETLIGSLTRQTGLILENARLLAEANRRALQLASLTGVATTITSDLQVDRITATLLDHLSKVIPFDTGTFWFRKGDRLTIRAAQGFEDDEERVGLSVSVEDSQLLSAMVASGQALNVPNVHADPRFLALPEFDRLSWLGIPLIAKGEVVGVIALEKSEAEYYDAEHVQMATTFAGQAAVALENARLFEDSLQRTSELDERSQRLDLLNQLSSEFSSSLDTDHILQFTTARIRETFDCRVVSAVIYDEARVARLAAQSPAVSGQLPSPFDDQPFRQLHESLGVMISEDVHRDPLLAPLADFWETTGGRAALVLSLSTGDELHGLLILHTDERLSSSEIDLAKTISNQVAVAVQNAQLFDRSRKLTADLERRVDERTQELALEHERTETLLGIITELSASLDMDIVLNRTLALINRITGAEQSTIIISNPADESLLRRASEGYTSPVPGGGESLSLDIDQGLAGWVIRNREPALIADIREDPRWVAHGATDHRSTLAIPLMLGAEALGALMLFHRETARFTRHHLELIQAAAKQVAVAVNNAHLYLLIRDQAERLGGMLRSQQIESSRLLAILESVVDGVIVTDSSGLISVFNLAAEQILNLPPNRVVGRPLDDFTGLFGKAGQAWLETIRTWSADPDSLETGESFSDEIALDENRVLAVNLAPVSSPHEFLGTVSIFRDITHLIEVDRMKSEFVATVSHELRTPLTSIKGYVDILLMGAAGEVSDQQGEFLQVVQENTERLNILVNDLLEVSRIDAGKVFLDGRAVHLVELAGEVATDYRLRSQEEKKGMHIEVQTEPGPPPVLADPDRLRQILDNLVGNAYNYTETEGEISIRFREIPGFIEIGVRDNGVGIAPKDQPQIFDRFYRGDAPLVTATAGTGLGLSIVRYLVELHGGEIRIESTGIPGKGSTFYFTIPIFTKEEPGGN